MNYKKHSRMTIGFNIDLLSFRALVCRLIIGLCKPVVMFMWCPGISFGCDGRVLSIGQTRGDPPDEPTLMQTTASLVQEQEGHQSQGGSVQGKPTLYQELVQECGFIFFFFCLFFPHTCTHKHIAIRARAFACTRWSPEKSSGLLVSAFRVFLLWCIVSLADVRLYP